MKPYTKTNLVCTNTMSCDALIEVTSMWFDIDVHGDCPVCGKELAVISVDVQKTNEGNKMETTENDYYNKYDQNRDLQDSLDRANIHIKRLQEETNLATDLRENLERAESALTYSRVSVNTLTSNRQELEEYLKDNFDDMEDHAGNIAEIFGISLTKLAVFNVTMNVRVNVEVPLGDVDTVEDFISENLSVESSDSDVQVEDYSIESCEED